MQQEKNTKALEWLESQKPETMPDVYLYTAEAVSKTDPNKSWTLLEKIKKEQAANGRYHYLKGTVLIALDKTEEALATLHVAKTFNEYKKASLWQILKIYQAKNDKEHCLKTLQDLEELEPNNRSLKQLLKYYE